jgi:hypothetical protein
MAATASTTYKGNAWGAVSPAAASSMRADSALLTTTEAERQSGLGSALLQRAIQAKELKACRVGDLPGKVKLNVTQPRTDFNIPRSSANAG